MFTQSTQAEPDFKIPPIPEAEIEEILEEHKGSIDMQCECCGTHYFFNKEAIDKLKQAQ